MKKINIFLFAVHHLSGNIAAQRFKGLIKYFDPSIYNIHIFTRSNNTNLHGELNSYEGQNIIVYTFNGQCLGRGSSLLVIFAVFLSAFLIKLPFILIKNSKKFNSIWMVNALATAESICQERLANGERCFVIGTYSPIDALIAARCLSVKFALPNLQDFRDGFVFESLGRKGKLSASLRAIVECQVINSATFVTSVSTALVSDFRCRYPKLRVELLPNGYNPADFMRRDELSAECFAIINNIPNEKVIIGHFGRISDSDQSRFKALEYFTKVLNSNDAWLDRVSVLFVGKLTTEEIDLINSLRCQKSIIPPVERTVALELMTRCSILLLVTGNGTGCATGKIFEYMAAGPDIVCFSIVNNEAKNIIEETGCGKTIIVGDDVSASAFFQDMTFVNIRLPKPEHNIEKYNKINQAKKLSYWIQEICL